MPTRFTDKQWDKEREQLVFKIKMHRRRYPQKKKLDLTSPTAAFIYFGLLLIGYSLGMAYLMINGYGV